MRHRARSHRNVTLAFAVILPLFMASFAGNCNKSKTPNRTPEAIAVDNLLTTKVRENLTNQTQVPTLRAIDIEINTFNQKVTLTGSVSADAAREEAIRLAGQTEVEKDGTKFKVKEVDASNLKVKPTT